MRSDLIFGALTHVTNRYQLCQLAAKATRKLHKPNTRLQDTTNEVLDRFKDTIPMDEASEPVVEKDSRGDHRNAARLKSARQHPSAVPHSSFSTESSAEINPDFHSCSIRILMYCFRSTPRTKESPHSIRPPHDPCCLADPA